MCRIAGILDLKQRLGGKALEHTALAMRDTMAHGGPDGSGLYLEPGLALAHRRLSILDLSNAGHQPMHWQNYVIVYNGEVYNFKEIRNRLERRGFTFQTDTDTEVILKSYQLWGRKMVHHFRGMFAFAIWDKNQKKLLLCRDRVGVKPLYWYWKDGLFLFASELKALPQHPAFDKTIDHKAVSLFLQQGYIHAPYCVFKYVRKLEGGRFLEVDARQNLHISQYWDIGRVYEQASLKEDSPQALKAELECLLKESFKLRMVADVPAGVFLSGGIDSTLVTALLQRYTNQNIKTFTIGFGEQEKNEAPYAKAIARHLNTDHTEFYCSESDFLKLLPGFTNTYDEPFGDSSGIPTSIVARLASSQVKVALSADGGDELFGGYTKYEITRNYFPRIARVAAPVRRKVAGLGIHWLEKNIKTIPFFQQYKDVEVKLHKFFNAIEHDNVIDFFHSASQFLNKQSLQQYTPYYQERLPAYKPALQANRLISLLSSIDIKTYLEGDIMCKVDRATMRYGLEGREPFLDHHLIQFSQSLGDQHKIKGKQTKYLLRQILYEYVPPQLAERPKQGFSIPLESWLRTLLQGELKALAHDQYFLARFHLRDNLSTIISQFLERKKYIPPDFIWYLYTLYQWHKNWP